MLGIEDYGSDVESGDDTSNTASNTTPTPSTPSSLRSKLPPPTSSSSYSLSLSEPSRSSSITHTKNSAAAPKPKRTKKKNAINLSSLPFPKTTKTTVHTRRSPASHRAQAAGNLLCLVGFLRRKPAPVIEKQAEHAVGVAGTEESPVDVDDAGVAEVDGPIDVSAPSTSFLPPSLKKGKADMSLEDQGPYKPPPSTATQPQKAALPAPALDFFSLGRVRHLRDRHR
ncbi:hypothetical protein JVT61DRAFT_10743 [Boletus reticuloceps]|uniref:Uncharacterized protein n=1 Tax=Boletus reticuloceps TaxID=495285 RepID=A0A8I2YFQ9_9AGAM|nr:hypothetical protein JVT61DRAFT_10743 [Boletus reticuloceps]